MKAPKQTAGGSHKGPPSTNRLCRINTTNYSLYLETDLNRVFTGSLLDLAATELRLVFDALHPDSLGSVERIEAGRSQVLQFGLTGSNEEQEAFQQTISRLAASAALFAHETERLLRPSPLDEALVYGTDLVTTQRYKGKTNERLTRAMLNLALAAGGHHLHSAAQRDRSDPITVLDPLCGRGTTLNWALAYGLNAVGIEIDDASLDHYATFFKTWAKRQRLPHKAQSHKPKNAERRHLVADLAVQRADLKAGTGQRVETYRADGTKGGLPIKRRSIDAIVTDLPYGVQHRGAGGPTEIVESAELVAGAVPVWRRWLRPEGSLCLAWNTKRASRSELADILSGGGFVVVEPGDGYSMAHTVDASIDRDVLLAKRNDQTSTMTEDSSSGVS